jgi:AcrR family transcriptional regulator
MTRVATGRPGRPAAATREQALARATDWFLAGERVDVKAIAGDLGLARATMHRWFGTREALIGEALATLAEERLAAARRAKPGRGFPTLLAVLQPPTPGRGARVLLDSFDRFNRELAATRGLQIWLSQEQERALRLLTSSGGIIQPRVVAAVERLIRAEIEAGAFTPAVAPSSLAYAIVRLAESFLYNDAIFGIRGDVERLREVEAALLGVS